LLVVGGVELEGGGDLIDRCAYDEEIRIMSTKQVSVQGTGSAQGSGQPI
jgi:hypothetical protein